MTFQLTKAEEAYLSLFMNKVSRSFTLVAPQVESPLDHYLAVAYLICRVVDNIEDCVIPFQQKQVLFSEFSNLLQQPELAEYILGKWSQINWSGLSSDEIEMMTIENGLTLWQIYARIPSQYRSSICEWAKKMADGMALVTNLNDESLFITEHQIRLPRTTADYNLYCFYVAGTVGRMITELAITYYNIGHEDGEQLLSYSEACGRALQKTNIVKDFATDLARGDSFLPNEWVQEVDYTPFALKDVPVWWKRRVILDVLAELDESVNYVINLPKTAVGYRKAGLLMMLPAYQTILLAAKRVQTLFTPEHAVKISRTTMGKCVIQAQLMASDDENIRAYGKDLSQQIRNTLGVSREQAPVGYARVSG